jgi:ADP-ribosylglycohydrolase
MGMDHVNADRFEGCLLGLALGDALGARYEGGLAERLLWSFIASTTGGRVRWTDTIGAMAGAIWGAANGARKLPALALAQLEQRERLTSLAAALRERSR